MKLWGIILGDGDDSLEAEAKERRNGAHCESHLQGKGREDDLIPVHKSVLLLRELRAPADRLPFD